MKCLLCNHSDVSYSYTNSERIKYYHCNNCDFIFRNFVSAEFENLNNINISNDFFDLLSIFDISNLLNNIEPGGYIKFHYSNPKLSFRFNNPYFFSRKSLIYLLHTHNFTNIKFLAHKNIVIISANKKANKIFKISFIVPVFNEVKSVDKTINELINLKLSNLESEIIIVESNSTDGTKEVVKSFIKSPNVKIIFQDKPLGKGNAVRAGLNIASGDFIAINDADDEYDVNDYFNLLPPLISGNESFVLGNRHHFGKWWKIRKFEGQPVKSFILNLGHVFFTFLINVVCRSNLNDPFTMFKIFRRDILNNVHLVSDRFDLDHEIVIKFIKSGYIPIEIPVNYISRPFEDGKKVRLILDPLNWLSAIFKFGILGR